MRLSIFWTVIDSDWRLSLWLCATEFGVGAPRCACGGSLRRFKALLVDLVLFEVCFDGETSFVRSCLPCAAESWQVAP